MDALQGENLTVRWWLYTLQGIAAILFGLAAVFWPGLTLVSLVYIFSAYILVAGMIALIDAFTHIGRGQSWILTMLLGVLQLGVGVYLLRNPTTSFAVIILLIGFSFIVSAIIEAVIALSEKGSATGKALRIVSAILFLVVGVFILMQPASSGVAFVWILGLMSLINGPIAIAMSMDVKKAQDLQEQA